jgi:co-chaperonin GroES (HSP10)
METEFKGQALNYNVFLKRVEFENITEAGVDITSETDKNEKHRKGVVVSIGNLCPKIINIGQEVLYDSYKASDVTMDGVTFESVLFADLVACFKK